MIEVVGDHLLLLHLSGLHCQKCEDAVRRALVCDPGVQEVEIDFPSSMASVMFDPRLTDGARLAEAVRKVGYGVTGAELVEPRGN